MTKIMSLLIVLGLSSLTAYSQDTLKLNLKEVTNRLIEGLECKEILSVRNRELRSKDSAIYLYQTNVNLYKVKDSTCKAALSYSKFSNAVCLEANSNLTEKNKKLHYQNRNLKTISAGLLLLTLISFLVN